MPNSTVQTAVDPRPFTLPAWQVKAVTVQLLLLLSASFIMPAVAHATGVPVRMFLPMHWPVILAGLCYGWRSGAIIGLSPPAVSYMISGMPPLFMLPAMTIELAVYGFAAGLCRQRFKLGFLLSTLIALIAGRTVFLTYAVSTGAVSLPFLAYLQSAMLPGIVGALGQLAVLPFIARRWVGNGDEA